MGVFSWNKRPKPQPNEKNGMPLRKPGEKGPRPNHVTETMVAGAPAAAVPVGWDADQAVTQLYSAHYRPLVRLATLLVRDVATAEEVVQDAFVAMHGAWRRLRDPNKALSYLRQSVVNKARSVLRHRAVVEKHAPKALPDAPSAEHGALGELERAEVIKALRTLPTRQREAIVLRYYGDLSEAQIADAMGISRGAVKSHTARGISALRTVLEQTT
ncbi:RNA polymerase sigma-70 factor (sigma-E family) [Actinorugispora endophytica]|uniref:RNA polymerase sigma-70 factor (Sigma-E family) n=2 Tax=Actinorugispora endophytica TaxID=1605990 RepID=A0A4R6UXB7_9ACTN|nr:RNA polymerase sigma-70 factor (sigma-E family) [Actinorugispora endophytica]